MVHTRNQKSDVLNNTTSLNTNFNFHMLPFNHLNSPTATPKHIDMILTALNTPMNELPYIPEIDEKELISSLESYAKDLNFGSPLIPSGLLLQGLEADIISNSLVTSLQSTPVKQQRKEFITPPRIIRQKLIFSKNVSMDATADVPDNCTTLSSTTKVLELVHTQLNNLQEITPKSVKRLRENDTDLEQEPKRNRVDKKERKSYTAAPPFAMSPSRQVFRYIIQNKEPPILCQFNRLRLESNDSNISTESFIESSTESSSEVYPTVPNSSPIVVKENVPQENVPQENMAKADVQRKKKGFMCDNFCEDLSNDEYRKNLLLRLRTNAFPGSKALRNAKTNEQFMILLQRERMFAESKGISFTELKQLVANYFANQSTPDLNWQYGIDFSKKDLYLQMLKDYFKE